MTDIVTQLRAAATAASTDATRAVQTEFAAGRRATASMLNDAADEIESLRAELDMIDNEEQPG